MLDPITVEVIQNRLKQIGQEAGITLINTAASLSPTTSHDLGFNIADHLGRTLVYSVWMPRHGTTLSYMLRTTMERFHESGIKPGDMFMVNNPYDGALHLYDIAVLAPVHYGGELIAWVGCATHHMDIRAMRPMATPDARDWFQEGIVFRPIKLVEQGNLRDDIFNLYLDNVRMPLYQGLDLKSQVAANNVAKQKIVELITRYGVDNLKACYEEILDFSEAKMKEWIKKIPQGTYEAIEYLDYDRVYTLKCTLIVGDSNLTFDFSGTDPQSGTYINSVLGCSVANLHNIIICMLAGEIEANEGMFRPVKVIIPEGTVLNCRPPAPCSGASTVGGWKAQSLTLKVLSQALFRSADASRTNAAWGSDIVHLALSGSYKDGKPYMFLCREGMMQGGGARATKDGFDVSNIPGSTNTSIVNVEDMEQRSPCLYLKRGICVDSGGSGKYRGGVAGEVAIKLHRVNNGTSSLGYSGKNVPAYGFAGGLPGGNPRVKLKTKTNVNELLSRKVPSFEEISGDDILLPYLDSPRSINNSDVFYFRCAGGGGFGQPEERQLEAVLRDVIEGYISVERARTDYKVVVSTDTMELDLPATRRLRQGEGQKATP